MIYSAYKNQETNSSNRKADKHVGLVCLIGTLVLLGMAYLPYVR